MSTVSNSNSSNVTIPTSLLKYLYNTKTNSEKLDSSIKKLYNEVKTSTSSSSDSNSTSSSTLSTDKLTDLTEKFVKYYNKMVDDNEVYNDSEINSLARDMKKLVEDQSSSLSTLGITIESSGKLKLDKATLSTAISNGDLNEFITKNEGSSGLFYNIQKIAKNLEKNNTYYLSDKTKQIIKSNQSSGSSINTLA